MRGEGKKAGMQKRKEKRKGGRESETETHKETKTFQIMLNDTELFPFKNSFLQHLLN